MEALLPELVKHSGPLGALMVVLFLVLRGWKHENDKLLAEIKEKLAELLAHEKKNAATLEDHSRRLARLEGHSITQPISIVPEPGF